MMKSRWALRWEGSDVKARIVVKGYGQHILDRDDIYASTPQLVSLKVLLLFALARNYRILLGDVSLLFFTENYSLRKSCWLNHLKSTTPIGTWRGD